MVVGVETELEHLAGGVLVDQRTRRPLRDDLAVVHDDEAVAELLGLVHVVGRQDQRHTRALEPEQPVPQDVARLRVQPGGGLVQQQDLGTADQ